MFSYLRHITLSIVFLSVALIASGRDSLTVRKLYQNIGCEFSAGYNLPSHGYYRGYNPLEKPVRANSLLHLKYSFGFQPDTWLGSMYPNVTQGVGLAGCTFYSHELMGTPVIAYIFQNVPLIQLKKGMSVDYAWELGGSYGWKQSAMIATRANIYVNVGLRLSYGISDLLTLNIGPEFTHCSNGDTKYPNGGSNMFNLKVGVTGHAVPKRGEADRRVINEYEKELSQKSFAQRMEYDLILSGGCRAGKVTGKTARVINDAFPFFCLNFSPLYRLNRNLGAGVSLDFLADRSANLYDVVYDRETKTVISYSQPGIYKQMAAGLSLKGEITMPIFTVGVGFGGFVIPSGNSLKGLYSTFSLKTYMSDKLFLNVTYRLSTKNFTHNMMYGMGVKF